MAEKVTNSTSDHASLASELALIFGKNVEKFRKLRRINKSQFSMMLGIGRPTLNLIERGSANPRLSLICAIATALEVDVLDLLTVAPSE